MKLGYVLGLMAAAFLIGGLMCRPDRRGDAMQRTADSLAVVVRDLTQREAQRQADSAATADTVARLQAALVTVAQRGQQAVRAVTGLRAALDAITDSMVPKRLAQALADSLGALVKVREAERDTTARLLVIAQRERTVADSLRGAWQRVSLRLQENLDAALKRRRWGCVAGVGGTTGVAVAGNAVQTTVGAGGSVGLGVTCGKIL